MAIEPNSSLGSVGHFSTRALSQDARRAVRALRRTASYIPRRLFGTITSVKTDVPAVALTFDDGPHPQQTLKFLEVLEAQGARGTFFLLGKSAARYPELVARIVAGGHALGNHSWDHPSFPAISARARRRQIRECAGVLGEAGAAKIFRPPYGNQTFWSRLDPLWLGWNVVTWNVCGQDWRGETAEAIIERINASLRPGSIVLLHDRLFNYEDARYTAREATLEAVRAVLQQGRFRFVTVPELLRLGRAQRELWIQPGHPEYLAKLKNGET